MKKVVPKFTNMKIGSSNRFLKSQRRFFSSIFALVVIQILLLNVVTYSNAQDFHKNTKLKGHGIEKRQTNAATCETEGCKQAAKTLLKFMNTTAKPCEDFYQFACGSFLKNTVIPSDEDNVDVYSIDENNLQQQLKDTIEKNITASDPETFKKLQAYYLTCLNTTQIEKSSFNDFQKILKQLGGWPVVEGDKWNETNFDWKTLYYTLRKLGYQLNYLIDFAVGADEKNNINNIIYFDQTSLGVAQSYLAEGSNNTIVQAYLKFMIKFAAIVGADRSRAQKELADIVDFEIALAKISLSSEQRRNESELYNPRTISQFQNDTGIPWLQFTNNLFAPDVKIGENEQVIVRSPQFFKKLPDLIAKTPKRVLANYLIWRVAFDSADQLADNIRKAKNEFESVSSGTTEQEARWKECIGTVNYNLPAALGALYVRKHFDLSIKANVTDMVEYFRRSFGRIINQTTWMDEQTRSAALEKLNKMFLHIGYPQEFLDNKILDNYHQSLNINTKSYLNSQLQMNLFYRNNDFSNYRKPVNSTSWTTHGGMAVMNSFYGFVENSITFPAAILQDPFYVKNRPNYLNFGAIGYLIGHEITHGWDDLGRQFDKDGNLIQWWQPKTQEEYLKRTQCIIDQYSNYTVKQINQKINGVLTQGENIADNGGIKEARSAYDEWVQNNGPEPNLPGLPYTPQQLFWVSASSIWCRVYRDLELRDRLVTDVHSPGEFRVIGPFSNRPEFAQDYNCPVGSPMNPVKKCSVW